MKVERTGLDNARWAIRNKIENMGNAVRQALHQIIDALEQRDLRRAEAIISGDQGFNESGESIHNDCIALIARQQPIASDLREIIADLQIAIELERIADHTADIAHVVRQLQGEGVPPVEGDIRQMAERCENMLAEMLHAYRDLDATRAEKVAAMDDSIDQLNGRIVDKVIRFMQEHGSAVADGTRIIWAVHNLERIGDRVTNIGEQILFATSARIVDWNRSQQQ